MHKLATAIAAGIALTAVSEARAEYSLSILHINDMHSRIESINRFDSTCDSEGEAEGKCFGGIARVKTKLDQRRAALDKIGRPYLTLDAGDQFQGSLFYSTYKGAAAAGFLNKLDLDAMAVGNHEFDDGPETLAKFLDRVQFPVISGNTSTYTEPLLKGRLPGYVIVEKGGEKIGIISVLATDTTETSAPGDNVKFLDEISYLKSIVPEVEANGTNKIIALTHVGLAKDKEIAASVEGIDVIVGGHSHTLLSNSDPKAEDKYPVWVDNPAGQRVPIVQAGANSKYLGELRVTFDDDGMVVFATGNPHLLDASVEPDPIFAAKVAGLAIPIEELKKQVIGSVAADIDGSRDTCRTQECPMGNLITDAMVERVSGQGVTIGFQNGGGIRASIAGGEVTMGDVLTVLPFQNTLATFQIKGSDLVNALENGVSQVEEIKGRFPQVSGLRFAWKADVEPMQGRIKQVQVKDGDGWTDIDPDTLYSVVTNNYVRGGGDGYKIFATNSQNAYDYGPGLEQVVADYIGANQPYKPYVAGRIIEGDGFDVAAASESSTAATQESSTGTEASSGEVTLSGEVTAAGEHVIVEGDNLWDLAKKKYGDATQWPVLKDANQIDNVHGLQIGDVLKVPEAQ